ncbi:hypothetical protein ACIQMY_20830 [Streptomyces sp. NPDC091368]|uniref:hypothetical protein n=1 Tax=Streptomyces sp. NPDC091368 TaxID=3365993 RepID=UPI0037F86524
MTRATAARARRAETAVLLADRLDRIAIGHLDRLTPAEAALLAETIRAMSADIEHLARDRLGLMRARSADIEKRAAAEEAIREAEEERDTAQGRAEFYEAAHSRMRNGKEVAAVRVRRAVEAPSCPDSIRRAVHSALDHQEQP